MNGWPDRHRINPLSFIDAQGLVVFSADGKPERGGDHLGFKLASEQGHIALLDADFHEIDSVIYGPQQAGFSEGRHQVEPNRFVSLEIPTPGIVDLELLIEPDTDRDGIPGAWEMAYGLNAGSNDSSRDSDGDGQSNISEFLSGTDPLDADSLLRFQSIFSRNETIVLTFQAVSERRVLAEVVGQEDSSFFEIMDNPSETGTRFYRLMIPPRR